MLLNDCRTEFIKHVFPKFLNPTTRLVVLRFTIFSPLPLSLDIVRFLGLRRIPKCGSSQPESLDDEVLAVSGMDFDELTSSNVVEVDEVSDMPSQSSFNSDLSSSNKLSPTSFITNSSHS